MVGCVVVAARRCRVGMAVWGMLHACYRHLTHAILRLDSKVAAWWSWAVTSGT